MKKGDFLKVFEIALAVSRELLESAQDDILTVNELYSLVSAIFQELGVDFDKVGIDLKKLESN